MIAYQYIIYISIILKYTKYVWLSFVATQTSKYVIIDHYILINKINDLSTDFPSLDIVLICGQVPGMMSISHKVCLMESSTILLS